MAEEYRAITSLNPNELKPDLTLHNECLEILHRHYPGWAWHVEVLQGLVIVRNLDLNRNKPWGFGMKRDMMDVDLKCVMRGGGEVLERFKRSRRGLKPEEYLEALPTWPFLQPEM